MTLALIILGIPILSYKINRSITNQAQEHDLIKECSLWVANVILLS